MNSAYRLRQSACYLKSSSSNNKMLCTTCHDPHHAPRGADAVNHYDNACRQCHSGALSKASHPAAKVTGCADCHMPKRRTEDVIHVVMTDHLISRTKPAGDLLAERKERIDNYRGEVVPYYPPSLTGVADADLYRALAQVKQRSNLDAGIAQLTAAIQRYAPQRADWYLELAEALENQNQLAKALPWYRQAVRRNPSSAVAWQKLGAALRRSSQHAEAITALQRSATLSPTRPYPWLELGLSYRSLGRMSDSLSALEKAIARDADLPEAHNNIGILRFQAGEPERAEASFREALRIQPNYADAHGNLANLLLETGRMAEAQAEFDRSLKLRPNDAGTRYNYAMLFGKTGRYDDAQRELEACLQADATFADAHELLGDLLMARNQQTAAVAHYREAARLRPTSMRAAFGLGLSLAATGNIAEAIPHLRKAAAGPDEEIRQRAADVLRQMGK
ncbi:MAG: tetratricopeptide repeat protein [Acidobacteria bacterium]|nr:tetratricopeptide repeat protein [Acidobacteriota bacterium]